MKRSDQFYLADVTGEHFLVPLGKTAKDFNGIIKLNDMGCAIWRQMENDTTLVQLVRNIVSEYEVTMDKAEEDIKKFIDELSSFGAVED